MPLTSPRFWYRQGGVLPYLLAPLSGLYGAADRWRRARISPQRVNVPVICVGNLVAGGAGKTPLALDIAHRLRRAGAEVHILSRGYGGRKRGPMRVDPVRHDAAAVGDEPLLLAAAAPTWVAVDRVAGARAAVAAGARLIVMDDGFQNPSLAKDLSIVAVDGAAGFGNGRVIPAGPLREAPSQALRRADAVVIIGADTAGTTKRIHAATGKTMTVLRARLMPGPDIAGLKSRALLAFAGIARPAKFFTTLREAGCIVVETHAFPDHHAYGPAELARLKARAQALGAELITTAKDHVRLPAEAGTHIRRLDISLVWDDEAEFDALLQPILGRVEA